MVKVRTTIMLEKDTLRQSKLQGVNISKTCQHALDSILHGKHFVDEEAYYDYLLRRLTDHSKKLALLDDNKQIVQRTVNDLQARIVRQKEIVEVIHKSRVTASLMRQLNSVIRQCNFNVKASWNQTVEIRDLLKKHDREMTQDGFLKHLRYLKGED